MLDVVWLNLVELSKQKTFREILSAVVGAEKEWKKWFDTDSPEEEDIPCGYQVKGFLFVSSLCLKNLRLHWTSSESFCSSDLVAQIGHLHRFQTLQFSHVQLFFSQARKYIYSSLGADFLENAVLDIEHLLEESDNKVRVFLRERLKNGNF